MTRERLLLWHSGTKLHSANSESILNRHSPVRVNQNAKEAYTALLENCVNPNRIAFTGYTLMNLAATKSDPIWLRIAIQHGGKPCHRQSQLTITTTNTPFFGRRKRQYRVRASVSGRMQRRHS